MKAESNLKPTKKFEIENIVDGKCDVVFYDDIIEIQELENEEEDKKYSYNIYRLKTIYRDDLEQTLNNNEEEYKKWLQKAKDTEYEELSSNIRKERDALLYATDKYTISDYPISSENKELMLEYRQKLRDLPEQETFPYNVEFPKRPNI